MNKEDCIKREMGYTSKEFVKTLQGQFTTHTSYSIHASPPDSWSIHLNNKCNTVVYLHIAEKPVRKIAMLSVPVLAVCFHFKHADKLEQEAFFSLFFKYFHKGGG